jgi:hypothetical protein
MPVETFVPSPLPVTRAETTSQFLSHQSYDNKYGVLFKTKIYIYIWDSLHQLLITSWFLTSSVTVLGIGTGDTRLRWHIYYKLVSNHGLTWTCIRIWLLYKINCEMLPILIESLKILILVAMRTCTGFSVILFFFLTKYNQMLTYCGLFYTYGSFFYIRHWMQWCMKKPESLFDWCISRSFWGGYSLQVYLIVYQESETEWLTLFFSCIFYPIYYYL